MAVNVDGHLDRTVAELVLHVISAFVASFAASFAGAVSAETRQDFQIGAVPGTSSIFGGTINIGADNEVARTILARALRELSLGPVASPKIWWNLEYAVNGNYVLLHSPDIKKPVYNLRLYVVTRADAAGRLEPTTWPTQSQQ